MNIKAIQFMAMIASYRAFKMEKRIIPSRPHSQNYESSEDFTQYFEQEHYESHTPNWQVAEWATRNWR